MKRRQLLKMLAVAPLIPLAAKLAPAVDYFGHGIPKEMVLTLANPTNFTVGDILLLDGFRQGGPKGKFTITKIDSKNGTVYMQ